MAFIDEISNLYEVKLGIKSGALIIGKHIITMSWNFLLFFYTGRLLHHIKSIYSAFKNIHTSITALSSVSEKEHSLKPVL